MADQVGIEEINARLNNIRSVEPILGAMRTISLGSWQSALNRQRRLYQFSQRLTGLLPILVPVLKQREPKPILSRRRRSAEAGPTSLLVLVIGSERGLCGAFNSSLLRYVEEVLERYRAEGIEIQLATLGSRAARGLQRDGYVIDSARALPMTKVPTVDFARELSREWLIRYEASEFDAVDVIYNSYRNSTFYEPVVFRLIPPALPVLEQDALPWPPPYVDTDLVALSVRLLAMWTITETYRILLSSAAAEHSARYQLMEGATRNSSRLIAELTLALQNARQQAITAEMQELAAGAGLLATGP